jgi:hypothetical protein
MVIEKLGHEIRNVEQWLELAPPKKGLEQWVDGRSALECARSWCAGGLGPQCPSELAALLASHPDTQDATLTSAEPECRIHFDKLGGEPRNADLAVIAAHPAGRLAINIEAKADETFGDLVRDVLQASVKKIANDERTNSVIRVQQLGSAILPPPTNARVHLGDLRYQLLTGIAGTIAFAVKVQASCAIFIVHEFVTTRTDDSKHQANALDLNLFVARLTNGRLRSLPSGNLRGPFIVPGADLFPVPPPLYIGKAVRNLR